MVIDYAETIAPPAATFLAMSAEDRNTMVILKRWAQSTVFLTADVTICLVTENLSELNQSIVQESRTGGDCDSPCPTNKSVSISSAASLGIYSAANRIRCDTGIPGRLDRGNQAHPDSGIDRALHIENHVPLTVQRFCRSAGKS